MGHKVFSGATRLPKFYLIGLTVVCFVGIEYLFFLTLAYLSGLSASFDIFRLVVIICSLIFLKLGLSATVFLFGLKFRFEAVTEISFVSWRKLCFQRSELKIAPEELAARTIADVNSTVNVWLFNSFSVVCDLLLAVAILAYIFVHADLLFVIPIMLVVLFWDFSIISWGVLSVFTVKSDVNMRSAG